MTLVIVIKGRFRAPIFCKIGKYMSTSYMSYVFVKKQKQKQKTKTKTKTKTKNKNTSDNTEH